MSFDWIVLAVAVLAGSIAAISGFGIGSLLTPLLSVQVGTKLAVAAVSIPHFIGTALRFWLLRKAVDRTVLWSFGIMSAVGGLGGALVHAHASSPALTIVLGVLLVFAGMTDLTGVARRMRFHGAVAWVAGAVSGALGGMVGNQGGIRAAALLGFDIPKQAFVATATAIGLFVDAARMPVYFAVEFGDIASIWPTIAWATIGVLLGTLGGTRLLKKIPERVFRRVVAVIILTLGVFMLYSGLSGKA